MAGSGWKKSAGIAALAIALVSMGAPSLAWAGQEDGGRGGRWAERHGGGDAPSAVRGNGGWQRSQAQTQAPTPEVSSPPAPAPRAWGGGNGGGWQGRRAESPAPAPVSQAPSAPPPVTRGNWAGRPEGGWRSRGGDEGIRSQQAAEQGGAPRWMGRRSQGTNETLATGESRPWRGSNGGESWRSGRNPDRPAASGDGEGRGREGGWNGSRGNGGGQPGWARRTPPAPQVDNGASTNPVLTNEGTNREGWRGRDRGYTDPNRNSAYRDGDRRRDGDGWRDGNRRSGNIESLRSSRNWGDRDDRRDGDRWREGRRDGDAWRAGRRDGDGWRDGNRRWSDNGSRRHGPGSSRYQPNRNSGWWNNYGWHNGSWRNNRHSYYNNGHWRSWDRNWRRDNRYDWFGWRNRNHDWFRLDYYYSPYRNYSYRRLSIGFFLDALFYSERYWLDDPWSYRLPEVYGPYRWIRYYDDVLLVNIYTGEVVDVIHDFFW